MLSGLSCAQHTARFVAANDETVTTNTQWEVLPHVFDTQVFDEADRVNPTDPVYAIPLSSREDIVAYFTAKQGF